MKNIYALLFLFVSTYSIAQIGIIENFDNAQGAPPFGWTADGFVDIAVRSCQNISYYDNMTAGQPTAGSLTTPYLADASNATDLEISFDYKVSSFSFFGGETAAPENWGSLTLEYTTNGTDWTNIVTLDESNYDAGTNCTTKTYTIDSDLLPSGTDFQARFVTAHQNGNWQCYIDNISLAQTATQAPACDAVITLPVNGSDNVDLDTDLAWSNANGLPAGYKLSVGTTAGGTDVVDTEDVGNVNTYSFASDLEFETTYYVTILPYNSFGDSEGDCVENSFTTRLAPLPGSSCDNTIVIDPSDLNYTTDDSTALYEDLHSTTPCGGNFTISGREVVYTLTPTEIISVNVSVTNILNSRTTLHIMDACPENGPSCYGYGDSSNSLDDVVLENVILEAGTTYYFFVANTGSISSDYTFSIEQNSCIIPAMELTSVGVCETNEFEVNVDITSLGSATSLTITDDQGSDAVMVDELGITTFGPYPSATQVMFTVTNDQDNTCVISDSTVFYCPPANDLCADATLLTVNTAYACETVTAATTVAATESDENLSDCSATTNDVWFQFVATDANHIIQILNAEVVVGNNATIYYELLEGDCGTLTSVACNTSNNGFGSFTGLNIGETYYVRAYSANAANGQNFDICVSTAPAAPANDDCANAEAISVSETNACENAVSGTTISATQSTDNSCSGAYNDVWYTFTPSQTGDYIVTLTSDASSGLYHYVYSGTCGSLVDVSSSCFASTYSNVALTAGETYTIMVRSNAINPGIDFDLCVYLFVPVANNDCADADVIIESPDSDGENTTSGTTTDALYSPEGCASSSNESVWYTFTPMYDGLYHVNFESTMGTAYFQMYSGDCAGLTTLPEFTSCFNTGLHDVVLEAGVTYYLSGHSSNPADFDVFIYPDPTIVPVPVPENDLCADAFVLPLSNEDCDNMVTGTTAGATVSDNNACTETRDVWYTFTPDSDGYFEFNVSENDTVTNSLTLYSGSCDNLTAISALCADTNVVSFLNGSETYYVMIGSNTTAVGIPFDLCAKPFIPADNNECIDAENIVESADVNGENTVTGSTMNAFFSEEGCAVDLFSSVWYTFTPEETGLYYVNLTSLTEDSYYQVYAGDCETGLTPIEGLTECNNVDEIAFSVEAGVTYFIDVHSLEPADFELFVYPDVTNSLDEAAILGLNAYPNPTADIVRVSAEDVITELTVYNMLGSVVFQSNPNLQSTVVDLETLTEGVYLIKVKAGDKTGIIRIAKN